MLDLGGIWPDWTVVTELGEGAYGKVYKCEREEHGIRSECAVKVITIPQKQSDADALIIDGLSAEATRSYFSEIVDDFADEIRVMEELKGASGIVAIEDYKIIERDDRIGWDIYIRMELLTPFKEYATTKTITQQDVVNMAMDICEAMGFCAVRNILHRDIKPENIFVDKFQKYKLGDFGVAKQIERSLGASTKRGTYTYMAPEVYRGQHYDIRADIYSLGMVMYKLLNNNRDPFLDTTQQMVSYRQRVDAMQRRFSGEQLPDPVNADPEITDIILKCCAFDPEERYNSFYEAANDLYAVYNKLFSSVPDEDAEKNSGDQSNSNQLNPDKAEERIIEISEAEKKTALFNPNDSSPFEQILKRKKPYIILMSLIIVAGIVTCAVLGGVHHNRKSENQESDFEASWNTLQNIEEQQQNKDITVECMNSYKEYLITNYTLEDETNEESPENAKSGFWNFNESFIGEDAQLTDLSGKHRHAVIHNWANTTVTFLSGKLGNYIWMNIHDPANEQTYLQVENDGSIFSNIGERIAVGGWILPTTYAVGNLYTPLLSTRSGDGTPIFYLSLLNGKPRLILYDAEGKAILDKSVTPSFSLDNTKWYFVAAVIEPNNHKAWYVIGDRSSGKVWTSQALTYTGELNRSCTADLIWGMLDDTYWYAGGLDEWFLDCDSEMTTDDITQYFQNSLGNISGKKQFGLCYIDNDEVPEMMIVDGTSPASTVTLVTYSNGQIQTYANLGSYGNTYFKGRENVLLCEESSEDALSTEVFHLEQGVLVSDWSGKKRKNHAGIESDDGEKDVRGYTYISFGAGVSKLDYQDNYLQYVPKWYDPKKQNNVSFSLQKQALIYNLDNEGIEECFGRFD